MYRQNIVNFDSPVGCKHFDMTSHGDWTAYGSRYVTFLLGTAFIVRVCCADSGYEKSATVFVVRHSAGGSVTWPVSD